MRLGQRHEQTPVEARAPPLAGPRHTQGEAVGRPVVPVKRRRDDAPPLLVLALAAAVATTSRQLPSKLPSFEGRWGHSRKVKLAGPAASRHGGRSRTRPPASREGSGWQVAGVFAALARPCEGSNRFQPNYVGPYCLQRRQ